LDIDDQFLAWLGGGNIVHKLLKNRMVEFNGRSNSVDGMVLNVVEAIVDCCLGICLEFSVLAKFSSIGWRWDAAAVDDASVI
jgi:hypothetical protein